LKIKALHENVRLFLLPPYISDLNKFRLVYSDKIFNTFVSLFDEIQNRMEVKKKYYTEEQEQIARYAKPMSHPVRVFILDFLAQKKCCYSGSILHLSSIASTRKTDKRQRNSLIFFSEMNLMKG